MAKFGRAFIKYNYYLSLAILGLSVGKLLVLPTAGDVFYVVLQLAICYVNHSFYIGSLEETTK